MRGEELGLLRRGRSAAVEDSLCRLTGVPEEAGELTRTTAFAGLFANRSTAQ
jgi:hypothetical protein